VTVTGGVAECEAVFDTAGEFDVVATFTGSGAFAPSASEVLAQTVEAAAGTTTTTTSTIAPLTPNTTPGNQATLAAIESTPTSGSALPSTGYDVRLMVVGFLLLAGGLSLAMIGSYRRSRRVAA
jgi:hypothetical protein